MDSIVRNLRDFYHYFALRNGFQPRIFPDYSTAYSPERDWPSLVIYAGSQPGSEEPLVKKWKQEIQSGKLPPFVMSDDRPNNAAINKCLLDSGFHPVVVWTGMKTEENDEQFRGETSGHLRIIPVGSSSQAALFSEMINREVFRRNNLNPDMIDLDRNDSFYAAIGFVDSTPVTTASVFFSGDTAGIYFVSTVPDYRKRGFGSIMTRHVAEMAGRKGFHSVVLHATEAGKKIYLPMGFREYGKIIIFRFVG